jgi:hypothetical protein
VKNLERLGAVQSLDQGSYVLVYRGMTYGEHLAEGVQELQNGEGGEWRDVSDNLASLISKTVADSLLFPRPSIRVVCEASRLTLWGCERPQPGASRDGLSTVGKASRLTLFNPGDPR